MHVTLSDPEVETAATKEEVTIITTPEELETYSIVKVILRDTISPDRVFYRDNRSYFNIIIDNNIRKWIIRVFFEKSKNYIMLNDVANDKERTIIEFKQPIDLIDHKDQILQTVAQYAEVTS